MQVYIDLLNLNITVQAFLHYIQADYVAYAYVLIHSFPQRALSI